MVKNSGVTPKRQDALDRMLHDLEDLVACIRQTVAELRNPPGSHLKKGTRAARRHRGIPLDAPLLSAAERGRLGGIARAKGGAR